MNQGFSLIEVMITVVIMCVGIMALAGLQGTASKENLHGRLITVRTNTLEAEMERLIDLDFADPDLADTDGDGQAGLSDTGALADHNATDNGCVVYWNVADDMVIPDTKTVSMVVIETKTGNRGEATRVIPERI